MARPKPWEVDDKLWTVFEPLLPRVDRRIRHPGRKRHPDLLVFQGILFVLYTGISCEHLPQELGFGFGMTCWRRLAEWTEAGLWPRLHETLLAGLRSPAALDFSGAGRRRSHTSSKARSISSSPLTSPQIPPRSWRPSSVP
ncbi:transposase [Streptomyces sp. VRA16 Mangrove soil]|uniref:transposase n=1 Tax=Streptomyces sp. VRA16 Mangrove soil TaxID=2817434 RepID=UPI001A9CBA5E|nr:transposase [Streptomyces sp. VRA16 Mangrove soil]